MWVKFISNNHFPNWKGTTRKVFAIPESLMEYSRLLGIYTGIVLKDETVIIKSNSHGKDGFWFYPDSTLFEDLLPSEREWFE